MTKPKPKPAPEVSTAFRDRIVDFRRIKGKELKRNKKNWRVHPESQKGALTGILKEIGIVGAVVARKVDDGFELLDGHLRSDILDDQEVPVLIVDLNDEEADKILLTYDPISQMAKGNKEKLAALLEKARDETNAEIRRLLADIGHKLAKEEEDEEDEESVEVPGMALQPHEHYDFFVVLASTTHEFNVLCDKFGLKPEKRRGRMGTSRAIRAETLLKLLEPKK